MNKIKTILRILIISLPLLISACKTCKNTSNNSAEYLECKVEKYKTPISRNDYGQLRIRAYPKGTNVRLDSNGWSQSSKFSDISELVLDGAPIMLTVDGLWSPYFEGLGGFNTICEVEDDQFTDIVNGESVTISTKNLVTDSTGVSKNKKTPCWFNNGMGVYLQLKRDMIKGTIDQEQQPCALHLGHFQQPLPTRSFMTGGVDAPDTMFYYDGFLDSCALIKNRMIGVKVMDSFYTDNGSGRYEITSKGDLFISDSFQNTTQQSIRPTETPQEILFSSGVYKPDRFLLQAAVSLITDPLYKILEVSYTNFVNGADYKLIYYSTLTLFIAITGIAVLFGLFSIGSLGSWVALIFKITFVVSVSNPDSWPFIKFFFWDTLFQGILSLAEYVSQKTSYIPVSINRPFSSFDQLITMFTSKSINIKIISLLTITHNFLGLVYVVIIYAIICCVIYSMIRVAILYIFAYISVVICLLLTPVMAMLLLFSATKEFFDNWFRTMVGSAMQIVFIFMTMGYFYTIFLDQMRVFKYSATWEDLIKIEIPLPNSAKKDADKKEDKLTNITLFSIKAWTPPEDHRLSFKLAMFMLFTAISLIYFSEKIPQIAQSVVGGLSITEFGGGALSLLSSIKNTILGGDNGAIGEALDIGTGGKPIEMGNTALERALGKNPRINAVIKPLSSALEKQKLSSLLPSLSTPFKAAGAAITQAAIYEPYAISQAKQDLIRRGASNTELGGESMKSGGRKFDISNNAPKTGYSAAMMKSTQGNLRSLKPRSHSKGIGRVVSNSMTENYITSAKARGEVANMKKSYINFMQHSANTSYSDFLKTYESKYGSEAPLSRNQVHDNVSSTDLARHLKGFSSKAQLGAVKTAKVAATQKLGSLVKNKMDNMTADERRAVDIPLDGIGNSRENNQRLHKYLISKLSPEEKKSVLDDTHKAYNTAMERARHDHHLQEISFQQKFSNKQIPKGSPLYVDSMNYLSDPLPNSTIQSIQRELGMDSDPRINANYHAPNTQQASDTTALQQPPPLSEPAPSSDTSSPPPPYEPPPSSDTSSPPPPYEPPPANSRINANYHASNTQQPSDTSSSQSYESSSYTPSESESGYRPTTPSTAEGSIISHQDPTSSQSYESSSYTPSESESGYRPTTPSTAEGSIISHQDPTSSQSYESSYTSSESESGYRPTTPSTAEGSIISHQDPRINTNYNDLNTQQPSDTSSPPPPSDTTALEPAPPLDTTALDTTAAEQPATPLDTTAAETTPASSQEPETTPASPEPTPPLDTTALDTTALQQPPPLSEPAPSSDTTALDTTALQQPPPLSEPAPSSDTTALDTTALDTTALDTTAAEPAPASSQEPETTPASESTSPNDSSPSDSETAPNSIPSLDNLNLPSVTEATNLQGFEDLNPPSVTEATNLQGFDSKAELPSPSAKPDAKGNTEKLTRSRHKVNSIKAEIAKLRTAISSTSDLAKKAHLQEKLDLVSHELTSAITELRANEFTSLDNQ